MRLRDMFLGPFTPKPPKLPPLPKRMRGIDMKVARIRAGLRQQDVADLMGCSRQRVTQLERMPQLSPAWVEKFTKAITQKPT